MSAIPTTNTTTTNTNTNTFDNYVDEKDHQHHMVYAGVSRIHCEKTHINQCADRTCGYWQVGWTERDESCCNLQVTRFSTRVTCYECSHCGRKTQDRS